MRSDIVKTLVLLFAVGGGACGDFVESGDGADLTTLGRAGGTLSFHELRLEIPADALSHTITLRTTVKAPAGAASEAFHVEPDGEKFALIVKVSIDIGHLPATGPTPAELHVVDFQHHPPFPLPGRLVEGGRISGVTSATGIFGLMKCPGPCPQ